VRTDETRLIPQFASDFLNAPTGRLQIDQLSRQIIGMTNINAEEIKSITLPLPSLSRQASLVSAMDAAREIRQRKRNDANALLSGLNAYLASTLGLTLPAEDSRRVFAVGLSEARKRFDPHFHSPHFLNILKMLAAYNSQPLGSVIQFSHETTDPSARAVKTFPYVEISSIDTETGEAHSVDTVSTDAPSRARMLIRTDDIIVSLTRPHHGAIAQVDSELDGSIASTGFAVIRSIDDGQILREYLWCILRTNFCLSQMLQRASGGNYPAITESELSKVLIPVPSKDVQQSIALEVHRRRNEARRLRAAADLDWQLAKQNFELQLFNPTRI